LGACGEETPVDVCAARRALVRPPQALSHDSTLAPAFARRQAWRRPIDIAVGALDSRRVMHTSPNHTDRDVRKYFVPKALLVPPETAAAALYHFKNKVRDAVTGWRRVEVAAWQPERQHFALCSRLFGPPLHPLLPPPLTLPSNVCCPSLAAVACRPHARLHPCCRLPCKRPASRILSLVDPASGFSPALLPLCRPHVRLHLCSRFAVPVSGFTFALLSLCRARVHVRLHLCCRFAAPVSTSGFTSALLSHCRARVRVPSSRWRSACGGGSSACGPTAPWSACSRS
jgi:hypothetical protein